MLDLILAYRVDAFRVVSLILVLAMLRWGGGPERAIALAWGLGFIIIHRGYHLIVDDSEWNRIELTQVDAFHAGLDIGVALTFVVIALYANRSYLLVIAALQLLSVSSHFVRGITDAISPIAYVIMIIGTSYLQIVVMGAGLWKHRKRLKKHGQYRDWRIVIPDRFVPIFGRGPQ